MFFLYCSIRINTEKKASTDEFYEKTKDIYLKKEDGYNEEKKT